MFVCFFFGVCVFVFVCVKKEALKKLEKEVERAFSLPPLVSFFLSSLARVHVLSPSLVFTLSLPRSLSHSRSLSLALSLARALSLAEDWGDYQHWHPMPRASTAHLHAPHPVWSLSMSMENTFYGEHILSLRTHSIEETV